jgi:hypothetical protein
MSDTIIITVMVKGTREPDRCLYRAMFSATMIARDIILEALRSTPPLLFRGCIATGEMSESSDFLIGPAVDEAAERYEKADGPFLWLSESALEIERRFADTYNERLEPALMIPYRVPMSDGTRVHTQALNYYGITSDAAFRSKIRSLILQAYGSTALPEAVRRKRVNTLKLLHHVDRLSKVRAWRMWRPLQRPRWTDLTTGQRLMFIAHGIMPEHFQ